MFIQISCVGIILAGLLSWLGWWDWYHAPAALAAWLGIGIAGRLVFSTERKNADKIGCLGDALFGLIRCAAVGGLFAGLLWGLDSIGAYDRWINSDRLAVEHEIQLFTDANALPAADSLIVRRLESPMSGDWRQELVRRRFDLLLEQAAASEDSTRMAFLVSAVDWAKHHDSLDATAAQSLLDVEQRQASEKAAFVARVERLQQAERWFELTDLLTDRLQGDPAAAATWAAPLYRAQLMLGDSADFKSRAALYDAAFATATRYALDRAAVEARQSGLIRLGQLRARVDRLCSADTPREAVVLLEETLKDEPEGLHRKTIANWLVKSAMNAGDTEKNLEQKITFFRRATEVANLWNIDSSLPQAKLAIAQKQWDHATSLIADHKRHLRERRFEEWIPVLSHTIAAQPKESWPLPYGDWLADAFLEWDRSLAAINSGGEQVLVQRHQVLRRAVETCDETASDYHLLATRWSTVDAELQEVLARKAQETMPSKLPQGATAGVIDFSAANFPPVLTAECWVEDAHGKPISGLIAKDFQADIDGQPAQRIALAPIQQTPPRHSVVIGFDNSGSTKGATLDCAKRGCINFLASLHAGGMDVAVRVAVFGGDDPRWLSEWTTDYRALAGIVTTLQAEGKTAFYRTADLAHQELASRVGNRRFLVFTDGKDTVGGPSIGEIIARSKRDEITVEVIALKTAELDAGSLRQLSQATGGQYDEVATPEEVANRFRASGRRFRRESYRLVIETGDLPHGDAPRTLQLSVGSPPIRMNVEIPEADDVVKVSHSK